MALAPGARLGTYEVIALVGVGGMGEVYRALDSTLGREVAIKVLPDAVAQHPERLARFEREARLLASLTHPNIAVVYGLERSPDHCYLVMELVRGETLAQRASRGAMPLKEVLHIFKQVAEGLEAAHGQSIIHRDLKPANIMITPQGTPKILDFGLAKVIDADPRHQSTQSPTLSSSATVAGIVMGTAAYMSPEQARGDPVDRRTDNWAFGCLVFEAVAGEQAFTGRTTSDTIAAVLREDPDWSRLTERVPLRLQLLIRRCLQKSPNARLHDIADARIEIEDVAHELVTASSQTTPIPRARSLPIKPLYVAALATVAVALFIAGALAGARWWTSSTSPTRSSLSRVMITLPAPLTLEKGRSSPVALSPDGTLLVYAASTDGGRPRLYFRPLNDLSARAIPDTDGASTPFFSPDGRWLAFYADGELKRVSVTGGVPLTICEAPPVWSATWGEGDTIVFATTLASSGLWLVSANGGMPAQLTTPESDVAHGYPQILPGGSEVLYSVRQRNTWQLALLNLTDRKSRPLGNGRVVGEGVQYLRTGHLVYAQAGGLVALPFDPSTGSLDQPPVALPERLDASRFGGAYFAVAAGAGSLVYAPAGALVERTLLRIDRDGRAAPLSELRAAYEHQALSPDGRRVAAVIASEQGTDIWLIDRDRGTRTRFTAGGTSAFPVWSPDGSKIAFQSTASGPWNLFWKPLDGSAEMQPILASAPAGEWPPRTGANLLPGTLPTLSGGGLLVPISWTPDGSTLAFVERKPDGDRDIWVVSPGSDPAPFLVTPFDEHSPRVSPDGRWLAYVSNESGRSDVYVQPFPGPGSKWLVSTDGGTDPVWARSGRELFYRRARQMMAVSVGLREEFSSGRPQRLFELPVDARDDQAAYDTSPEGPWFLTVGSDRGAPPSELHIVLHWFDELGGRRP
jgi:eukaryotic-like serine/threonine-protein kinase